ncbi:MAG: spore coat protein [Alicyclobacillus sp.]|nr:spore coat protein [Alicyclobacillus sp.]
MNASPQIGAHELIGMNEALMSKAANAEYLSFLSHQVENPQLQQMLQNHAQHVFNHYMQGVQLLQSLGAAQPPMQSMAGTQGTHMNQAMQTQSIQMNQGIQSTAAPKLGLRHPSMPQPNLQAQVPSERSICTLVLNMHKFGAVGGTTLALECTHPQLRSYLMNGAHMCDALAYEIWSYMNQKEYYQVPTLMDKTTQTMIHSYQAPQPQQPMQTAQAAPVSPMGQYQQ